ncbi:hypothetical protein EMIT0196MI5_140146 [Pseudomonas sp. IT-196MI5]
MVLRVARQVRVLSDTQYIVGASLLAMTDWQATLLLNVPASSRASSLPQCFLDTRRC